MRLPSLKTAKARLTIPELWHWLGLPGQPAKSCKSPFRDDHRPSFSIYAEGTRWRDFTTGKGGDAIAFLAQAKGLRPREACREFLLIAKRKGIF